VDINHATKEEIGFMLGVDLGSGLPDRSQPSLPDESRPCGEKGVSPWNSSRPCASVSSPGKRRLS
jgi:hypothetical protein